MIIGNETDKNIKHVQWLEEKSNKEKKEKLKIFIKGAVYCWCKNFGDKAFAARDLFGGVVNDWKGTPLYDLYEYEKVNNVNSLSEKQIQTEAGKKLGIVLKEVIDIDDRNFSTYSAFTKFEPRTYKWEKSDKLKINI